MALRTVFSCCHTTKYTFTTSILIFWNQYHILKTSPKSSQNKIIGPVLEIQNWLCKLVPTQGTCAKKMGTTQALKRIKSWNNPMNIHYWSDNTGLSWQNIIFDLSSTHHPYDPICCLVFLNNHQLKSFKCISITQDVNFTTIKNKKKKGQLLIERSIKLLLQTPGNQSINARVQAPLNHQMWHGGCRHKGSTSLPLQIHCKAHKCHDKAYGFPQKCHYVHEKEDKHYYYYEYVQKWANFKKKWWCMNYYNNFKITLTWCSNSFELRSLK